MAKTEFNIYKDTLEKLNTSMTEENIESKDEYINKAIDFYAGYLSQNKNADYLIPVIIRAIRGELITVEKHISEMLFKLAVEQAVLSNILAAAVDADKDQIEAIRDNCAKEISFTNGIINFERAYFYQREQEIEKS